MLIDVLPEQVEEAAGLDRHSLAAPGPHVKLVEGVDKVGRAGSLAYRQPLSFRTADVPLHLRAMETRIDLRRIAVEYEHVPECRRAAGCAASQRRPDLDPPDPGGTTCSLEGEG